jgi:hypothetical protein
MVIKIIVFIIIVFLGVYLIIINWIKGLGNPNLKNKIESQFAKEIFENYFLNKVELLLPILFVGIYKSYFTLNIELFSYLCILILSSLTIITHPKVLVQLFNMNQIWLQFTSWFGLCFSSLEPIVIAAKQDKHIRKGIVSTEVGVFNKSARSSNSSSIVGRWGLNMCRVRPAFGWATPFFVPFHTKKLGRTIHTRGAETIPRGVETIPSLPLAISKGDDLVITILNSKGKGFLGYERLVDLCDFKNLLIYISNESAGFAYPIRGINSVERIPVRININNKDSYKELLINRLKKYFSMIDKGIILNCLPIITYYDKNNSIIGSRTFTSAQKFSNSEIPLFIVEEWFNIIRTKTDYYTTSWLDLEEVNTVKLSILDKVWLSEKDLNDKHNFDNLVKSVKLYNKEESRVSVLNQYIPNLMDDLMGYENIIMNDYGNIFIPKGLSKEVGIQMHFYINEKFNDRVFEVNKQDSKTNIVKIRYSENIQKINGVITGDIINNESKARIEWKDKILDNNKFIRYWGKNLKIYYECIKDRQKEGYRKVWKISNIEKEVEFPNLKVLDREIDFNDNIGAMDFETLSMDSEGLQQCYAGGWTNGKIIKKFMAFEINELIVLKVINSIFEYIFRKDGESKSAEKKRNGMTFFVHNLGRFDAVFIIKDLIQSHPDINDYEVKGKWKTEDNRLIQLRITHKKSRLHIKLVDSMSFFGHKSLNSILKSFNIPDVLNLQKLGSIQKGIFPHSWINKDRLSYIGPKPDTKYYKGTNGEINQELYNSIPENNWNVRSELDKYLTSDIIGLYKAVRIYAERVFNRYRLNITDFTTLPSLAKGVFTSNYYDEEFDIKVIKGQIEKNIRSSYFGGLVQVLVNDIVNEGYGYDVNSQYPNAMLMDMPVGNPIITLEKDINKLFGFTYGKVIPPKKEDLRVLLLRHRNEKGESILSREPFEGWFFTELIKEAIKYGYKFEVITSYQFKRGKNVFSDYVNIHYNDKKNAEDNISKEMAKLFLNSLYGKFGMKDIESNINILSKEKSTYITKNYNYDYIIPINDYYSIVKYRSKIPEKIRKWYKEMESNLNVDIGSNKIRGVDSSIPIASAISSYALLLMFKYMNIPGNLLLYMDTDGIVLSKPLNPKCVGTDLGLMKLEYSIKRAVYASKKFYAVECTDGRLIKKAVGMNSNQLTFQDYIDYFNGKSLKTNLVQFNIDWSSLQIRVKTKEKCKLNNALSGEKEDNKLPLPSNVYSWSKISTPNKGKGENRSFFTSSLLCYANRRGLNYSILKPSLLFCRQEYRSFMSGKPLYKGLPRTRPISEDNTRYFFKNIIHSHPEGKINDYLYTIIDNTMNLENRNTTLYKLYNFPLYSTGFVQIKNKNAEELLMTNVKKEKENTINNLTKILEDIYDNNEFVVFKCYFMSSEYDKNKNIISVDNTFSHFNKYNMDMLNSLNTRVYKNTGFIFGFFIFVFLPFYDIDNLRNISRDIYNSLIDSIYKINLEYNLDLGNTVTLFNKPINPSIPLTLFIEANYDEPFMLEAYKDFFKKNIGI